MINSTNSVTDHQKVPFEVQVFSSLHQEVKNRVGSMLNVQRFPKIVEDDEKGNITVHVYGVRETKLTVNKKDMVGLGSKNMIRKKALLESQLGGKLSKFIKNKKHRKAIYHVLSIVHSETVIEMAFYIKSMYGE